MKIICDTNIWYGIGNGSINLNNYAFESIHATYVNVDEICIGHKERRWQRIIQDIANFGNYLVDYKNINNCKK